MVHGLRIMALGLCITSAVTFSAGAQQAPLSSNPNRTQSQRLMQDMKALREQLGPLRSQMQQLMAQIKEVREKMRDIEGKMKADRDQMKSLHGG